MRRAPEAIPRRMRGRRTWGGVQKQKTSGRMSFTRASASKDVRGPPSLAAAFASLSASRVAMPASSKRGFARNAAAWWRPRLPRPTTTTLYGFIARSAVRPVPLHALLDRVVRLLVRELREHGQGQALGCVPLAVRHVRLPVGQL